MNAEFESYVQRYSADLTRFCFSLCKNTYDAENLFQETWLKAMKNLKRYNPEKSFDKWLFAICANTFKDRKRLFFNRQKLDFSSHEEKSVFLNSIPDISSENSFLYLELHNAVSTLPKKERVVLALYYFKDYTIKEISEILNTPESTVKSRLKKAKSDLKRRLGYE